LDVLKLKKLGVEIFDNPRLCDFTTFKLGGPCPTLFDCKTPEQIQEVIRQLAADSLPFIVVGEGSNIIVSDKGLDCYVVRFASNEPIFERVGDDIFVSASAKLDDVVSFAAEQGLEGINFASGIPGTVGGAVVGNAGAFGRQISDSVSSVEIVSKEGIKSHIEHQDLGFKYRDSILKKSEDVVLSVQFSLKLSDNNKLLDERKEFLTVRWEKHPCPEVTPCAGSIFKNIEPKEAGEDRRAAGWYLDQAGAKDLKVGGASVFNKHANIIVKSNQTCLPQDVFDLSNKMAYIVKNKFGLELEHEVRFLGDFK